MSDNKDKELTLSELREIQVNILKDVDEYCQINNIKYFLTGGTMIGAIRHRGYIPWDDDIDISMLRSDYEKFVKHFKSKFNRFELAEYRKNDWYNFSYAKIYDNTTILIENHNGFGIDNMGVNIDVFPIDECFDSTKKNKFLIKRIFFLRTLLRRNTTPVAIQFKRQKNIFKNMVFLFIRLITAILPIKMLIMIIDNECKKHKDSNYCGIIVGGYGLREIVSKDCFLETMEVEFEGVKFKAPIGYDAWLTNIYGDYMELPPKEKRVTHHEFKAYKRKT